MGWWERTREGRAALARVDGLEGRLSLVCSAVNRSELAFAPTARSLAAAVGRKLIASGYRFVEAHPAGEPLDLIPYGRIGTTPAIAMHPVIGLVGREALFAQLAPVVAHQGVVAVLIVTDDRTLRATQFGRRTAGPDEIVRAERLQHTLLAVACVRRAAVPAEVG